MQHSWLRTPNIVECYMLHPFVGSCYVKFESGKTFSHVQMDTTTPNIVGPTMLGVVVSVCM